MATIEPAIAGVTVYFKVWNVDDPFDQNNASMPGVSLIDGDFAGPDNRGTEAFTLPWTASAQTDESGIARVTFDVSMQPGNNYRAGALVLQDAINQATQTIADEQSVKSPSPGNAQGYSVPLVWSQMLTVWRKLHLEVDSMDAESMEQSDRESNDLEWARFVVMQPTPEVPAPIRVGVPDVGLTTLIGSLIPQGNPCSDNVKNRWEGGSLAETGGMEYLIVRNECHVVGQQSFTKFIVFGDPGNVIGVTFNIRDDDLYFPPSTPHQLPQLSVLTNEIKAAYADAYVDIIEASATANLNTIVDWQSNVSPTELALEHDFVSGVAAGWDLDSAPAFWHRHFVVCYQSGTSQDVDSDAHENCSVSQNCPAVNAPYQPVVKVS